MPQIKLPKRCRGRPKKDDTSYEDDLQAFAIALQQIDSSLDFKQSSRGWCYQLEGLGQITKGDFDVAQKAINECREAGLLPIDFVAEEEARQFDLVESSDREPPEEYLQSYLRAAFHCVDDYEAGSFWHSQDCYVEMFVEKIDLKSLFYPVCEKYRVAIASTRGWSSILQRGRMIERFKIWEEEGKQPVLLYCGDHDPDGILISHYLRDNIDRLSKATGWTSANLIIDRFGLNYDLIQDMGLSWIDNLEASSGKPADEGQAYVRDYVAKYGRRKVEANALVIRPREGRALCEEAIQKYVGIQAFTEYDALLSQQRQDAQELIEAIGWRDTLLNLYQRIPTGCR